MANIDTYQLRPGATTITFVPDQLIAGNLKLVTQTVTFSQGSAALPRGTVVGRNSTTGQYALSVATATDGTQIPVGIIVDTVDPTNGAASGSIYVMGEFNYRYLSYDSSWTEDALIFSCRQSQLFVKTALSNDIV